MDASLIARCPLSASATRASFSRISMRRAKPLASGLQWGAIEQLAECLPSPG
jgi:hypothetical protein